MTFKPRFCDLAKLIAVTAVIGMALPSIATPGAAGVQRKGGGGGRSGGGGGAPRGGGGGAQPAHARREAVRTPTFVPQQQPQQSSTPPRRAPAPPNNTRPNNPRPNNPRPNNSGQGNARPGQAFVRPRVQNTAQRTNDRKFTKTPQGRRYDNGLQLRKGIKVVDTWERPYFPRGNAHFPFYRPTYSKGHVFISPFGFFFGLCVPYIDPSCCHVYPPTLTFIDVPLYNGNDCIGYTYTPDDNWFDHQDLSATQPGLVNAIDELSDAFQTGNVDALAALISPNVSISVYLRGKYKYSLSSSDFVDLTRDAMQDMQTVSFNLTTLYQRQAGVFCVSGTQVYTARDGSTRTVYVSYVLQDFGGQWTLTQVGTAPDRVQAWH